MRLHDRRGGQDDLAEQLLVKFVKHFSGVVGNGTDPAFGSRLIGDAGFPGASGDQLHRRFVELVVAFLLTGD